MNTKGIIFWYILAKKVKSFIMYQDRHFSQSCSRYIWIKQGPAETNLIWCLGKHVGEMNDIISRNYNLDSESISRSCIRLRELKMRYDCCIYIKVICIALCDINTSTSFCNSQFPCSLKFMGKRVFIDGGGGWGRKNGHSVRWEPEGRYQYFKMFHWEPEGRYRCTQVYISPFWFSTEHIWIVIAPFWLSTDGRSWSWMNTIMLIYHKLVYNALCRDQ